MKENNEKNQHGLDKLNILVDNGVSTKYNDPFNVNKFTESMLITKDALVERVNNQNANKNAPENESLDGMISARLKKLLDKVALDKLNLTETTDAYDTFNSIGDNIANLSALNVRYNNSPMLHDASKLSNESLINVVNDYNDTLCIVSSINPEFAIDALRLSDKLQSDICDNPTVQGREDAHNAVKLKIISNSLTNGATQSQISDIDVDKEKIFNNLLEYFGEPVLNPDSDVDKYLIKRVFEVAWCDPEYVEMIGPDHMETYTQDIDDTCTEGMVDGSHLNTSTIYELINRRDSGTASGVFYDFDSDIFDGLKEIVLEDIAEKSGRYYMNDVTLGGLNPRTIASNVNYFETPLYEMDITDNWKDQQSVEYLMEQYSNLKRIDAFGDVSIKDTIYKNEDGSTGVSIDALSLLVYSRIDDYRGDISSKTSNIKHMLKVMNTNCQNQATQLLLEGKISVANKDTLVELIDSTIDGATNNLSDEKSIYDELQSNQASTSPNKLKDDYDLEF